MNELFLLSLALVALGIYNWKLTNKLAEANETLDEYNSMIMEMALELEKLGSPNVKVYRNEIP